MQLLEHHTHGDQHLHREVCVSILRDAKRNVTKRSGPIAELARPIMDTVTAVLHSLLSKHAMQHSCTHPQIVLSIRQCLLLAVVCERADV